MGWGSLGLFEWPNCLRLEDGSPRWEPCEVLVIDTVNGMTVISGSIPFRTVGARRLADTMFLGSKLWSLILTQFPSKQARTWHRKG